MEYKSFDKVMDMGEKTYLYILIQGEAVVISSQKQYDALQRYNSILNRKMARASLKEARHATPSVEEESNHQVSNNTPFEQMNDDDFFAQRNTYNIKSGSFKKDEENAAEMATIEDPRHYPRLTFKEERLSMKIKTHLIVENLNQNVTPNPDS